MDKTDTGHRDPTEVGNPGPDAPPTGGPGVTGLAKATAAIITARWSPRGRASPPADPVGAGDPAGNGYATNAHAANGSAESGYIGHGFAESGYVEHGYAETGFGASGTYGSDPRPASGFTGYGPSDAPAPGPPALPHRVRGSAPVTPGGPVAPSMFEPASVPGPSMFEPGPTYESAAAYAPPPHSTALSNSSGPDTTAAVPTQRPAPDEFTSSVMSDLAFPEPFVPEPYEPYDPYEPRPKTHPIDPLEIDTEPMLPQRVPAEPDVPKLVLPPNDPLSDPATASLAEPRQLSRIATYLRDDGGADPAHRPDGFDLAAVIEAVRRVPDVSDAHLRWNPESGHILRIELRDGMDEGEVTRQVVLQLRDTLGLTAGPSLVPDDERERVRASAQVRVSGRDGRARHPLPPARRRDGSPADLPRAVLDHVQVATLGQDATVEVRLAVCRDGVRADTISVGTARGPAVDAYLLRLAAQAAGDAVDRLLVDRRNGQAKGRIFVEHAAVVPFGGCEVAVVVLLLVGGPSPEQLSGSTIVTGDPVPAVVRATLSAVNRRLESLLS